MVMTTLRLMDSGAIKETVECSDADFDMTMAIIRVISEHNDYIFNVLDLERAESIVVAYSYSVATRKTILASLPGYFKAEDMKTVAKNVGKVSAPYADRSLGQSRLVDRKSTRLNSSHW